MKRWLFAGILFLGMLLFDLCMKPESSPSQPPVTEQASLTGKEDASGAKHGLAMLSSDSNGRTCVLPRQTTGQSVHHTANERTLRSLEKQTQQFRLKGENRLRKTHERVSDSQKTDYFTLLSRRGYYVIALRKLLI
jgi:hypothetical protein